MKPERIYLILSILGIFILLILSNFNKPVLTGEVSSFKITKNSINIHLQNQLEDIVLINKTKIQNIKQGDTIQIWGDKQISINQTTIFVDKLICTNC